jgi:hypothetical protein
MNRHERRRQAREQRRQARKERHYEDDTDGCMHCDAIRILANHGLPLIFADEDEDFIFTLALTRGQREQVQHMLDAHSHQMSVPEQEEARAQLAVYDEMLAS